MRNQGAKVERTLDADAAGLSRDAAPCWVLAGLRCQETPPTHARRPVWVLTPHQASAVVMKVSDVKLCKQSDMEAIPA